MSTNVRQLFDLSGKTALVTGGSRGLGLQIAEALGEAGARVMLTSRKAGDLEESAGHLKERGIDALWIAADMSLAEEIVRVTQDAISRLGQVDILVNNAGATWGAAAEDHPLEAWDKVMNLNIRSIFLMSQAIGKHSMIPRKSGKIINVASIAGLAGNSADMSMLAYNTSKAAVVNFTRTLAGEWGKYNINVNALAPGMFPSKMTRGTIERIGAESLAGHAPLLRIGDDDDLKGATLLFASQAGKHITGQILPIDGGVSAIIAGMNLGAGMKFKVEIPFVDLLGFELLRFERGEAEIALQLRDELSNSWGVAHGGVTMTLLDVAMAHAARSPGEDGVAERTGVVTIEMKTSFMRPGLGRLVATGRRLHRTASMAFCEASLVDAEGQLIAHATGTFKFLKGLPAGGKRIQRSEASD